MILSGFRSKITRILVRQRYQWIPVRMRFCGSSDAPWSEWYDRGPGIGDPESWSGLITPWHQMQSIHPSKNTDTYLLVPVCKFHWQVTSALLLPFASSWWKLTQDATCVTRPLKLQRISPFGTGANAAPMYFLRFRREAAENWACR